MTNIDEDVYEEIIDYALSRYSGSTERIDWDDLLYRIDVYFEIELPEQMLDPVIVKLKRDINRARREANE